MKVVICLSVLALLPTKAFEGPRQCKAALPPFHQELLEIAEEYRTWGRVDDEFRWAPFKCVPSLPGRAYVSASKDPSTHGQKLYSLFARNRSDYLSDSKGRTAVVGQAIVKQSWVPEEVDDLKSRAVRSDGFFKRHVTVTRNPDVIPAPKNFNTKKQPYLSSMMKEDERLDHFYPYAIKDSKVFKTKKQADLFIMMKLDPNTPGTDAGWVYATMTPDGKKVTEAGRIESCMACHRDAGKDRLFGLQK